MAKSLILFDGPCVNRTRDQRIKSPLLYLTELTAHIYSAYLSNTIGIMCQKVFRLDQPSIWPYCKDMALNQV